MPRAKELFEKEREFREVLRKRNASEKVLNAFEELIKLFKEWKAFHVEVQNLRAKHNRISEALAKQRTEALMRKANETKKKLEELNKKLAEMENRIRELELLMPNFLADDVPAGDERNAKPLSYVGTPIVFSENVEEFKQLYPECKFKVTEKKPIHHYELVGSFIDQEKAASIASSRFYFQFDELVLLDFALTMYAFEFFKARGYADRIMIGPYLMRKSVEKRITYYSTFEDTIFELAGEELLLVPSSEHTIVAYYSDRIFEEKHLPLRILAWSPCFRREAGAHGKDTKGIFRTKQFHKLEIHCITRENEDFAELERLQRDIQQFMLSLGLANRAVLLASADTDARALKQIDIETWMPAQNRFRETHSLATVGTWIAEKTLMRYRTKTHEKKLVRNVYATAVATQRTICAIIENFADREQGIIKVPKPLHKYMFGIKEIPIRRKIHA